MCGVGACPAGPPPPFAALSQLKTYVRGPFSTLRSLYRTLRYYTGSVATASFLIAFLQARPPTFNSRGGQLDTRLPPPSSNPQMVRAILAYIQRQLKSQGQNSATLRFLFCCAQCCLKCLQVRRPLLHLF